MRADRLHCFVGFFAGIALLMSAATDSMAETYSIGPGMATCSQFRSEIAQDPLSEYNFYWWAQGWLSGINAAEATACGRPRVMYDLFAVSVELQMLTIRQFCAAHPSAQYTQAVAFMRDKHLKMVGHPALPEGSCPAALH